MAGIPIHSAQSRSGGWRLLGGGKTDLSGLTESETRALFLTAGPSLAAEGATPELKAALRKLVRALPESFRSQAEAAAASTIIDSKPWEIEHEPLSPPPFLEDLQTAVILGVQVELGYTDSAGMESTRTVHPLGLVSKGTNWYLLANTGKGQRTFRLDRIVAVSFSEAPVQRAHDFDLAQSWRELTEDAARFRSPVEVHASCAPEGLSFLHTALDGKLHIGPALSDGRIPVTFQAPSEYGIAGHLAGLVEWLEITRPKGVRDHLARIGAALSDRYAETL